MRINAGGMEEVIMDLLLDGFDDKCREQIKEGITRGIKTFPCMEHFIDLVSLNSYDPRLDDLDFGDIGFMVGYSTMHVGKYWIIFDKEMYGYGAYQNDEDLVEETYACVAKSTQLLLCYDAHKSETIKALEGSTESFVDYVRRMASEEQRLFIQKYVKSDEEKKFVKNMLGALALSYISGEQQTENLIGMCFQTSEIEKRDCKILGSMVGNPDASIDTFKGILKCDDGIWRYLEFIDRIETDYIKKINSINTAPLLAAIYARNTIAKLF